MSRLDSSASLLRRNLQDQLAAGKRLLALTMQEMEAIMQADVAGLARVQHSQQQCIERQTELENSRRAIMSELVAHIGGDTEATLSGILPLLPARDREALARTKDEILLVSARLTALNQTNGLLLEKALEYVKFSLDVLTNLALQPAKYGTNLTHIAAPSFFIDSRV